jgi:hypothetical protein
MNKKKYTQIIKSINKLPYMIFFDNNKYMNKKKYTQIIKSINKLPYMIFFENHLALLREHHQKIIYLKIFCLRCIINHTTNIFIN